MPWFVLAAVEEMDLSACFGSYVRLSHNHLLGRFGMLLGQAGFVELSARVQRLAKEPMG